MINVCNVSKIYKDKKGNTIALDNINIQLPNKGFIGLSGENGCGKTTLLNLLSTLDSDFDGDIYIDNLNVKKCKDYIRKNIISFVFQENLFVNKISVEENLKLINSNINSRQLDRFEIRDKMDKTINELSGGQKQKVSLIRSLEKESRILLVDEPTSSLDERTTKKVFEILSEIAKDKLVILVSHDLEMMNAYCNLIVRLSSGKLEYIKNNNTISDVIYDDTGVTFRGEVNLHSISVDKMNEIINNNKQFIIKKEEVIDQVELDYGVKESPIESKRINKNQRKLLWKSYFKIMFLSEITFLFILSVFILLFEVFFDFRFFNSSNFIYETLKNNQDSYLICNQDGYESSDQRLRKLNLDNLSNEYSISTDYVYRFDNNFGYDFSEFDIYSPYISNNIYTNFNNFKFVEGELPVDTSKVVISDYIADALITANLNYSDYADILEKGIFINEENLGISGIINTNYEIYKNKELSEKELTDFLYYRDILYSPIFHFNSTEFNEYEGVYVTDIDRFTYLKIDDTIDSNHCKVNMKLASLLNYNGDDVIPIKTNFGELYVDGVIEDYSNQSIIYASSSIKQDMEIQSEYFDYFMIDISNKEVFDFLQSYNVKYYCYSSAFANKVVDTVTLLQRFFAAFITIILISSILYILSYYKNMNRLNNNLYCLTIFNGYSYKDYILTEIGHLIIFLLSTFIFNVIVYYLLYNVMNIALTNTFGIDIFIFNGNVLTFIYGTLVFIIMILIIYFINAIVRHKKNMIKFIR